MALQVNKHVTRLRRFQPFQPDCAELIYEQSNSQDELFPMSATQFLARLIEEPEVRLVVLTGDAGHGKTSLCSQLLVALGLSAQEAARRIVELGDASEPMALTRDGRPLWLLSDLSNFDVPEGAQVLLRLIATPQEGVAIVCGNEGRLRSSVAADETGTLACITETLEEGIKTGRTVYQRPDVHVVNLNFQSVAPDDGQGLIDWAIKQWAVDRRRWQICSRCDASAICPILANHSALSGEANAEVKRGALRSLFLAVERTGTVVTTRQALALIAYALTGGLTCADVHKRYRWRATDTSWQFKHLFHQALFGESLSAEERRQIACYERIRGLDPGYVALRHVDDSLSLDTVLTTFGPPVPADEDPSPRSRREARRSSELVQGLMRFLRRASYFDADSGDRMDRLGFRSGERFSAIARTPSGATVEDRDKILRGLEAIQGVYRPMDSPDFLLLDPAFFANRSRAAVVARRIPGRHAVLRSQIEEWENALGASSLPSAVDWSTRQVYLRVTVGDESIAIPLDLLRFELLIRWAQGLSTHVQHEAEIRSLTSRLSVLTRVGDEQLDDIEILVGSQRRTLTIDVGERIRSGRD